MLTNPFLERHHCDLPSPCIVKDGYLTTKQSVGNLSSPIPLKQDLSSKKISLMCQVDDFNSLCNAKENILLRNMTKSEGTDNMKSPLSKLMDSSKLRLSEPPKSSKLMSELSLSSKKLNTRLVNASKLQNTLLNPVVLKNNVVSKFNLEGRVTSSILPSPRELQLEGVHLSDMCHLEALDETTNQGTFKRQSLASEEGIVPKKPKLDINYKDMLKDDGECLLPEIPDVESIEHTQNNGNLLREKKRKFLNAVSASLLRSPNFKSLIDETRLSYVVLCKEMAELDPEFVLKVALYTRRDLGIRTTANFLLAFAGNHEGCRPYLKKYFKQSVMLPSDWIEVAEIYQTFQDANLSFGALPSSLRRSMVEKFPDFDKYQLAKYNKEKKSNKKTPTKTEINRQRKGKDTRVPGVDPAVVVPDEDSDDEETKLKTFTLKQLIRQLHIKDPVEHVMCLIGKKYPSTSEEFYLSRLPGMFDETLAGKRMKLPIPETWETQISMRGNRASIWQQLIDNKKLPFMAMLRNIRNMLKTGISEKHHQVILKRLTDQGSVINSKQFPFRFFSAYQILDDLEKDYKQHQEGLIQLGSKVSEWDQRIKANSTRKKTKDQRRKDQMGERLRKKLRTDLKYDVQLLERYRKALDKSVEIATDYNIPPIHGSTMILCNAGWSMFKPCTTAKGLGKPREVVEIAILLALMCRRACESCDFMLCTDRMQQSVSNLDGGILANTSSLVNLARAYNNPNETQPAPIREEMLQNYLIDRKHFDNIIVLSDGLSYDRPDGRTMHKFLKYYRHLVNARVLFVSIDLSSNKTGLDSSLVSKHPNDVFLAGFSDQLLSYVAERGDSGQITYVDNIDRKYNLTKPSDIKKERVTKLNVDHNESFPALFKTPRWRVARIFISSTFLDMHGERDILTRFVFPEIRNWARKRLVNVLDVDLRWGVSEHATQEHGALAICLQEVLNADYFIGILGERYGWTPDNYDLPPHLDLDWIKQLPIGQSVTSLEFHLALATKSINKSFFMIRDPAFIEGVPMQYRSQFCLEDSLNRVRMQQLKDEVRTSGAEVFNNYPAVWGGVVENKPIASGLEKFAVRVMEMIKNAILRDYPLEDVYRDQLEEVREWQNSLIKAKSDQFKGRQSICADFMKVFSSLHAGLVLVHGEQGTGKTSFMAKLATTIPNSFRHIVCPGYTDMVTVLQSLNSEISTGFNLPYSQSDDYHKLVGTMNDLLSSVSEIMDGPFVILIDGIDYLDAANAADCANWVPEKFSKNVIFLLSCVTDSKAYSALKYRRDVIVFKVGPLDILDKSALVKETLQEYGKQLNESPFNNQLKLLTGKKGANNPLYLMLVCQELRLHGVFEEVTQKLKAIPPTLPKLMDYIFKSLEDDFGSQTISCLMRLLYCIPQGVSIDDMRILMSAYLALPYNTTFDGYCSHFEYSADMIPSLYVSQVLSRISVFLEDYESNGILKLSYKSTFEAIKRNYVCSADDEVRCHNVISAFYLHMIKLHTNLPSAAIYYKHLIDHLKSSNQFLLVQQLLSDLAFLNNKCSVGLVKSLNQDYCINSPFKSLLLEKKWLNVANELQEYSKFIYKNTHILAMYPTQLLQLALNEPDTSKIHQSAKFILPSLKQSYFDWITKPQSSNNCLATIQMENVATSLTVSDDTKLLAVGGEDCQVHIYRLSNCEEQTTLIGHAHTISCVAFVGAAKLMSASHDNTVSLWDINSGHRLAVMDKHSRRVSVCVALSRSLLTSGWDGAVYTWGLDGKLKAELCRVPCPINAMAVHKDECYVAIACWDSTIKVFNIQTSKRLAVLHGHNSSVRSVAYSKCGHFISSASLDGEVKLWSAVNGSKMGTFDGHSLPVRDLCFASHGDLLITGSEDSRIKVWSNQLGRCLGVWPLSDEDAKATTCVACVSLNSKYKKVVAGTGNGYLLVFNTDDMTAPLLSVSVCKNAAVTGVCWSNNYIDCLFCTENGMMGRVSESGSVDLWVNSEGVSKFLSICSSAKWKIAFTDNEATVYVRAYGAEALLSSSHSAHKGAVKTCSFNSSGSLLASGGNDGKIVIWQVSEEGTTLLNVKHTIDCAHSDWVTSVCWSDNVDILVSGSVDCHVKLWDLKKSEITSPRETFIGHEAAVTCVSYMSGCIVSSSYDGVIKVWSQKGSAITSIKCHPGAVNSCSLGFNTGDLTSVDDMADTSANWSTYMEYEDSAPDHRKQEAASKSDLMKNVLVTVGTQSGAVQIWNPLQATEISQYVTSSATLSLCAFENKFVSSHLDKTVRVWDLPVQKVQKTQEHTVGQGSDFHQITALAIKNQHLLTGSFSGQLTLWSLEYDLPCRIHSIRVTDKSISGIAFFENTRVVVSSEDASLNMVEVSHNKTGRAILRKVHSTLSENRNPVKAVMKASEGVVFTTWNDNFYVLNLNTMKSTMFRSDYSNDAYKHATSPRITMNLSSLSDFMGHNCLFNADDQQWITAVSTYAWSGYGPVVCLGDDRGILHSEFGEQKCHENTITAVATSDAGLIITSSLDCHIKVWEHTPSGLKLMNKFVYPAPITTFVWDLAQSSSENETLYNLYVGDKLGNISKLQYIHKIPFN